MPDSNQPADDALLFFREMVEPTVAEFMANRADRRRGCLACLVLASMTEHFFHARPVLNALSRASFKTTIRNENWAVGAIADVANATKHVVGAKERGKWSYNDLQAMEIGQCGVLRCGWPINGEEVLVGSDHEWRLSELIECVMEFWRTKLGLANS